MAMNTLDIVNYIFYFLISIVAALLADQAYCSITKREGGSPRLRAVVFVICAIIFILYGDAIFQRPIS